MASTRTLAITLAAATMLTPFTAVAQIAAPLPAQPAPLANPNAKADADQKKVLDALHTATAELLDSLPTTEPNPPDPLES